MHLSLISDRRFCVSLFWNFSIAGLDRSQTVLVLLMFFDTGAPTKIQKSSFFLVMLLQETLPSNWAQDTIIGQSTCKFYMNNTNIHSWGHDNLWKLVGINLSMSSSAKKGIFGKREDPGCSTAHHICCATHKSMSSAALPKCMLDFLTLSREMSPNISNNVPRFDVPSDTQIKSEHGIPSQHRDPGRSRRTPLVAANMPGLRTPTQ